LTRAAAVSHVIGRFDGGPGAFDEGGAGVEGIVAEQGIDALRHVAAQAARRPGEGHGRALCPSAVHRGQTVGRKSM
jgi:hypothetical protein